jgi:kynurenine formamidase
MTRIRTDKLWDLSQPIRHDGPAWAEYDPPTVTHNYRREAEGFNAETLRLNTHTGTHVDVPFHFDNDGPPVDRMPLAAFAGPAALLDLLEVVEPATEIGPEQLGDRLELLEEGVFAVLVTAAGRGLR